MTSNPMLRTQILESTLELEKPMTVQGAINKTFLLLGIALLSGAYTWGLCLKGYTDKVNLLVTVSAIIGLILAVITTFKPQASKITSSVYALFEGIVLGGVSFMYESAYGGIVLQAIGITLIALFSMLFLYTTGIIKATEKFKKTIIVSTLAIMVYYLISFVMGLLGHPVTIFNGGLVGIGISFIFCVIASLNFIIDFDFIERGANAQASKCYEWYGAFGLMVTIVWLYFEVLRLLVQLNRRN